MESFVPVPPSGEQFALTAGPYAATVTEAGATLRELAYVGRPLLAGFAADEVSDMARGQLLAPWPNRVAGGRYELDGEQRQLDVTEPATGCAIHGLVRWDRWTPVARAEDAAELAYRLFPRPGYPHVLDLEIRYDLHAERGLRVTTSVVNVGAAPAPWGAGQHPYLTSALPRLDACTLRVPAGTYLSTDERGIPVGEHPVEGTPYDFRTARPLDGLELDHPFGDLERDERGRAVAELGAPDGAVTLWCDQAYRWLQVFTGAPPRPYATLAVEPMSCPPNAFVTGRDLVLLEPGEGWSGRWGLAFAPG